MLRKVIIGLFVTLVLLMSVPLQAAEFPTKEVQIIIPWAAGGATDLIFRALAATTGKYLGKAVIVVNRPGGGGAVGYTEGAKPNQMAIHLHLPSPLLPSCLIR